MSLSNQFPVKKMQIFSWFKSSYRTKEKIVSYITDDIPNWRQIGNVIRIIKRGSRVHKFDGMPVDIRYNSAKVNTIFIVAKYVFPGIFFIKQNIQVKP